MAFADALIAACDADVVLVTGAFGGNDPPREDQPMWRCRKSSVWELNPSTFS